MPRSKSLSTLLRSLLLVAGVSVALAIFWVSEWAISKTVNLLSEEIFFQSIEHTRTVTESLVTPAEAQLNTAWDYLLTSGRSPTDGEACEEYFRSILAHHPLISAIHYANANGEDVKLWREDDAWVRREVQAERRPGEYRLIRTRPSVESEATWVQESYDPRVRPWYLDAVDSGTDQGRVIPGSHWSAPYTINATGELGSSISQGRLVNGIPHVLSFDIKLSDLQSRLSDWGQREGFRVAVWDRRADMWLVGGDFGQQIDSGLLSDPDAHQGRELSVAGATWHVRMTRDVLGSSRDFTLVVFVPQLKVVRGLEAVRNSLLVICLLITLALVVGLGRIAHGWRAPLNEIFHRFNLIGRGNLSTQKELSTGITEFDRLVTVQNEMRQSLLELSGIRKNLDIAREIQQQTFPSESPALPGLEMTSYMQQADETGGDSFDLRMVGFDPESLRFCSLEKHPEKSALFMALGDATGHGIGPALIVAQIHAMMRMGQNMGGRMTDVIQGLNKILSDDTPDNRFMTFWLGVLDPTHRRLFHFSAGQAPLLYFNAESQKVHVWEADAPPLAALPDLPPVEIQETKLYPGDILIVLSDGFFEARNPQGEMFGLERMIQLIEANGSISVDELKPSS